MKWPNAIRFSPFRALVLMVLLAIGASSFAASTRATEHTTSSVTVVLVHGAMADSSTWDRVIPKLAARGYGVVAVANPLRALNSDAQYVSAVVKSIPGPVILVGHSYGGAVITNAAFGNDNVRALVFVAAVAPEAGESTLDLVGRFPGSGLAAALAPAVLLPSGDHDLHVDPSKFREPFAADVSLHRVQVMAATQRPVTQEALKEPSGVPAWKTLPSWFIYGTADKSIPPAAHEFMAERANARRVQVIEGASHVVMISHPREVAAVIDEAAAKTSGPE